MTAHGKRIELVRSTSGWFWRTFAANGEQIARSSETYASRVGALRSVYLTFGNTAEAFEVDERGDQ